MSTTRRFVEGDRVWVTDPGLESIRRIMANASDEDGKKSADNHRGTVNTVYRDTILIDFADGGCAPYEPWLVHLEDEG